MTHKWLGMSHESPWPGEGRKPNSQGLPCSHTGLTMHGSNARATQQIEPWPDKSELLDTCWDIHWNLCGIYMYILLISIHMQVRKKINMIHMMHPHVHHYMDMWTGYPQIIPLHDQCHDQPKWIRFDAVSLAKHHFWRRLKNWTKIWYRIIVCQPLLVATTPTTSVTYFISPTIHQAVILFVIRTIIDHSLPIYKWFPQLWTFHL